MSAQSSLTGPVLVSCAKANAAVGLEKVAGNCGYGNDLEAFKAALQTACQEMGVAVEELSDLLTDQQQVKASGGLEIAPEMPSSL